MTIVVFFLLVALSVCATIWHVNNIPSMAANFSDIGDAFNSTQVIAGDTLYVYGSPTTYGSYWLYKRLTIIGPGYFLGSNSGLQNNPNPAHMVTLYIDSGAEGSIISGMTFDYLQVDVPNVVLQRNHFTRVYLYGASNCILLQNYFNNGPWADESIYAISSVNLLISNNYLGFAAAGYCMYIDDSSGGVLCNNVTSGDMRLRNIEAYNNIFTMDGFGWGTAIYIDSSTNSFHHNVFKAADNVDWSTVGVTGTANLFNVEGEFFLGTATTSPDGSYQLCTGSPAIGAGVGGADCGMFGGTTPYKISGIPAIPTIYEFYAPATGFTIPVHISARTNN